MALPSLFSLTRSTISRTSDEKKSLATAQSRDARGVPAHSYSRKRDLRRRPQPVGARERARVDERLVRAARVVRADGATEPLGEVHVQLGAAVEVQDDDRSAYESERVLWREAKRAAAARCCAVVVRVPRIGCGEASLEGVHDAEHDGVGGPLLGCEARAVVKKDGAASVVKAAVGEEARRSSGTVAALGARSPRERLFSPFQARDQRRLRPNGRHRSGRVLTQAGTELGVRCAALVGGRCFSRARRLKSYCQSALNCARVRSGMPGKAPRMASTQPVTSARPSILACTFGDAVGR